MDWFKLKAFEEDKSNFAKLMNYVFDRVENIMGEKKEKNAGYRH